METERVTLESLHERILKLEKQNRRLRRFGVLTLIGAALVIAMAQAPARKTIEANDFVVKDAHGNTRIRIGVDPSNDTAELWLQTPKGEEGTSLSENGILMKQDGVARTIVGPSAITLTNSKGQPNLRLTAADDAERDLFIEGNTGFLQYLPGHALEISDNDGYVASIGSTELRSSGGSSQTNAASMVLFDPDKKVLFKAP